ncbi:unnamed protein product [Bursaphelenchus okinawaensis]|uniref:Uncharacterized protein n=1 Tax=Bursaphelenchus okinawaensis TaxID=465554 RepID=A0A811KDZ6_9BILA|nr:unnamed protein product [Bursaphelenchus okinawaensis]CAG9101411.1 unnamed protein product [Bursaphelenchus okinawaensis]
MTLEVLDNDKVKRWENNQPLLQFAESLSPSVAAQVLNDSTYFAEVHWPNKCKTFEYACLITLYGIFLNTAEDDAGSVACAPCKDYNDVLQRIYEQGPSRRFYEAIGYVYLNFKVVYDGKLARLMLTSGQDKLTMDVTVETTQGVDQKYVGIFIVVRPNSLYASVLNCTISYSFVRDDHPSSFCEDADAKYTLRRDTAAKFINLRCYFRDTRDYPLFTIPQALNRVNFLYQPCEEPYANKTCMSPFIGGFLSSCSFTFIEAGNQEFYCGGFFNFLEGNRSLDSSIATAIIFSKSYTEKYNKFTCGLFMSDVRFYGDDAIFHKINIGCLCAITAENRFCDMALSTTAPSLSIPNTTCTLDAKSLYTGPPAYCYVKDEEYGVTDNVQTGSVCYMLNDRNLAFCVPTKQNCECCCFTAKHDNCNSLFAIGKAFESQYLVCMWELQYGPFTTYIPNFLAFNSFWLYADELVFSTSDIMDFNREFEKLYGFFVLDMKTLKVIRTGIYNPVQHSYAAAPGFTDHAAINRYYNRRCGNVREWTLGEISGQHRCFYKDKFTMECCTSKTFGGRV